LATTTVSVATGQGDYRLLERMASVYNYVLKEIPKHVLDEIAISSTNIREAIIHSDIDTANKTAWL
jgi:riboflavin kinase/FMN adenylyltransferase